MLRLTRFLAAWLVVVGPATATSFQIELFGVVNHSDFSSVQAGDSYHVVLEIDADAVDSDPSPAQGSYLNGILSYALTVGVYSAASHGGVFTFDTPVVDRIGLGGDVSAAAGLEGFDPEIFTLLFRQGPTTLLSSDALPDASLIASDSWPSPGLFTLSFCRPGTNCDRAVISGAMTQIVPEPGTALLVAAGLLGLSIRARARRNRVA